jgi:hypothetical protein
MPQSFFGACPVTDAENDDAAQRRQLGLAIQNVQYAARAKGIELGTVSGRQILEMAEGGELKESAASVAALRALMNGLDALLRYVKEERRVCPQPHLWSRLFDLLPNKRRVGN